MGKRLLNEAKWREEDPFAWPSPEPREAAPPQAATAQPRPEAQLNLPHPGDIWDRMQQEKQSLAAINLYRMGQAPQAKIFGALGTSTPGGFGTGVGSLPGHLSPGAAPALSIDPGFLSDHHVFMQSIGDGRLSPDELAHVHGVTNGVNAYRLGGQPGPIGGEAHQAAAADLDGAADRLARANPRVATAVLAYGAAHDAAARTNWGAATATPSARGSAPNAQNKSTSIQAPPSVRASPPARTGIATRQVAMPGGIEASNKPLPSSGPMSGPRKIAQVPHASPKPPAWYIPTAHQKDFLKRELAMRGLPTKQIDGLKFVRGLDAQANKYTRVGFGSGADAVTQGSTIYVQPSKWNEVLGFRSPVPFEEAYRTAQFASDGGPDFYPHNILLSGGGLLFQGDKYRSNVYEAFAQGASRVMFENWKTENSRRLRTQRTVR